jgi:hypothetical protein
MRLVTIVFALLLTSLSAFAADVAGAWNVTVDTPNGPLDVTVTLKQDGDKLTGMVSSQMGDAPITGTVKDNDLTFTMNMDANGANMTIIYKAKVDGDKMTGSLDFAGQGEIKFSGTKKKA